MILCDTRRDDLPVALLDILTGAGCASIFALRQLITRGAVVRNILVVVGRTSQPRCMHSFQSCPCSRCNCPSQRMTSPPRRLCSQSRRDSQDKTRCQWPLHSCGNSCLRGKPGYPPIQCCRRRPSHRHARQSLPCYSGSIRCDTKSTRFYLITVAKEDENYRRMRVREVRTQYTLPSLLRQALSPTQLEVPIPPEFW